MSGTLSRVRYPCPGCRMRISLTSGLTIGSKPIHDRPGRRESSELRVPEGGEPTDVAITLGADGHGQEQPSRSC